MIPTTGLRLVFLKTRTGASREGAFSQAKAFLRTWKLCGTVTIRMWLAPLPLVGSETLCWAGGRKRAEGFGRATCCFAARLAISRCLGPGLPSLSSDVANLEVRNIPRGGEVG